MSHCGHSQKRPTFKPLLAMTTSQVDIKELLHYMHILSKKSSRQDNFFRLPDFCR